MNQLQFPCKQLFEKQLHILTQKLNNTSRVKATQENTGKLARKIFDFIDAHRCFLDSANVKTIKDRLQKVIKNSPSTNAVITNLIHKIDQSYKVGREESKQNLKNSLIDINKRRSKIENSPPEERQRLKKMDFMLEIGLKVTQQQIAETS